MKNTIATTVIAALFLGANFLPAAEGYGAQNCQPDDSRLVVLPGAASATVITNLGLSYAVTGEGLLPDGSTNTAFIGTAVVADSNALGDCNGDGIPGDYDGDLDVGIGGFFFGTGTTWEALCAYGHNVHSTSGTTSESLGLPFILYVGVDDPNGPTPPVYDPATGTEIQGCQTDGVIAANPGGGPSPSDGDCINEFAGNGPYDATANGCAGVGGDDGIVGVVACAVFYSLTKSIPLTALCLVLATAKEGKEGT